MSFQLVFSEQYNKRATNFLRRRPELAYRITLELWILDEQVILVNVADHDPVY